MGLCEVMLYQLMQHFCGCPFICSPHFTGEDVGPERSGSQEVGTRELQDKLCVSSTFPSLSLFPELSTDLIPSPLIPMWLNCFSVKLFPLQHDCKILHFTMPEYAKGLVYGSCFENSIFCQLILISVQFNRDAW